jgi:hypothetical protein
MAVKTIKEKKSDAKKSDFDSSDKVSKTSAKKKVVESDDDIVVEDSDSECEYDETEDIVIQNNSKTVKLPEGLKKSMSEDCLTSIGKLKVSVDQKKQLEIDNLKIIKPKTPVKSSYNLRSRNKKN